MLASASCAFHFSGPLVRLSWPAAAAWRCRTAPASVCLETAASCSLSKCLLVPLADCHAGRFHSCGHPRDGAVASAGKHSETVLCLSGPAEHGAEQFWMRSQMCRLPPTTARRRATTCSTAQTLTARGSLTQRTQTATRLPPSTGARTTR